MDDHHTQLIRAIARYETNEISLATAAKAAGIGLEEFMLEASKRGVPILRGDQASFVEDVAIVAKFRDRSRR